MYGTYQSVSPEPIKTENEILSLEKRKKILEQICTPENQARKNEAFKRYECYKDRTKYYVIDCLLAQFDLKTVIEMTYAVANISVVKKIINKLAMVYAFGVRRELPNEGDTEELNQLEKELEFNSKMKKANRFLKLQKNILVYPKPCPIEDKWKIKIDILQPYLYDVIEDYYDHEKPMVIILSNYKKQRAGMRYSPSPATEGRGAKQQDAPILRSNQINEQIADADDQYLPKDQFVWWSKSYHFTTDKDGNITSPATDNPIGMIPQVEFALDQDGSFWAIGGDDLIDAGVLVNSIISHLNHIGIVQGYGQFWMKGEKVPTAVAMGPSKMIRMEWTGDEKEPQLGFASTTPQLEQLRENVVMYLALTLTTNNLSTSGVSTKLDGGQAFPAGIAMILDKAESLEDIDDQRQIFIDKEPEIWKRIAAWMDVFGARNQLVPDLQEINLPPEFEPQLKFASPQPIISEKERLENLKNRKDLGLNTMLDLIKLDNPELTDEQARQKLKEVLEDRIKRLAVAVGAGVGKVTGDEPKFTGDEPGPNPASPPLADQEDESKDGPEIEA